MTTPDTLPRWDLTALFPAPDSPELAASERALASEIATLEALWDELGIDRRDTPPPPAVAAAAFERLAPGLNTAHERAERLLAYLYCAVAADSRDQAAQAALSRLQQQTMRLALLGTRLTAWLGSVDTEALIADSPAAATHAFLVRQAKRRAAHLMSPAEEALAAELELTGSTAWSRLYRTYASQISVPLEQHGERRELPMAAVRNLAFDTDREVRRRAYEAELAAWERAAVPIAAALNSIKGEVGALARRRGYDSPLDVALLDNNIDRATLEAMLGAAEERFPDFRRYLRAKARALGLPALAWYDLFAPVGAAGRAWPYDEATRFITERFGAYSPRLRDLAARAFRERWVDAPPRDGKSGGAFCMPFGDGDSRILTNYQPTFTAVATLAHELGHAYHNLNLAGRTPLQRDTPMTLAETASIFCETLATQAALEAAAPDEQITILDASLMDACQVVVDITSRFRFEQAVFERRRERDLAPDELCELMRDAQRATYGDGLDAEALHPYMWAAKPHYYGATFYNFPYMFGLLFGLGLYAQYRRDPAAFAPRFDELLASTGMDDPAGLAARFGIDLRDRAFWRASLDVIRGEIERFEALAGR
jgi:pepF/M3 family oligoendopeptidase